MSMPQIPEEKNRPSLCEVTIDILKSVALEETALSHILNAEGERSQAMIKKFECCPDGRALEGLNESVRQTEKMLNTIIMKEWLLLRKLETAFEINQKMDCKPKDKECGCRDGDGACGVRITDCEPPRSACKCAKCRNDKMI